MIGHYFSSPANFSVAIPFCNQKFVDEDANLSSKRTFYLFLIHDIKKLTLISMRGKMDAALYSVFVAVFRHLRGEVR
jgi:hypothetical protein